MEALPNIQTGLPFPLLGVGSDNGGEFINIAMKTWCEQRNITFTRSRSYHKNDNCYVEQKNGDVARKTSGCARYTNEEALAAVYRSLAMMGRADIRLADKYLTGLLSGRTKTSC